MAAVVLGDLALEEAAENAARPECRGDDCDKDYFLGVAYAPGSAAHARRLAAALWLPIVAASRRCPLPLRTTPAGAACGRRRCSWGTCSSGLRRRGAAARDVGSACLRPAPPGPDGSRTSGAWGHPQHPQHGQVRHAPACSPASVRPGVAVPSCRPVDCTEASGRPALGSSSRSSPSREHLDYMTQHRRDGRRRRPAAAAATAAAAARDP